jgi:predicted mannosyl-3-phosphoglycerate phosphatase (HAD superfamily)
MVVVTAIDRVFGDGRSLSHTQPALAALRAGNVPIVCVSAHGSKGVARIQQQLGIEAPFVCRQGRELHIPHGYFWSSRPAFTRNQPANIIRTDTQGNAVAIVTSLYRACRSDVMIVGIAGSAADSELLNQVDVPILIRPDGPKDFSVGPAFSSTYVTHCSGVDGWNEAILGWPG